MPSKIIKRDPKEFWKFAEKIEKEIATWPLWKKHAADSSFITKINAIINDTKTDTDIKINMENNSTKKHDNNLYENFLSSDEYKIKKIEFDKNKLKRFCDLCEKNREHFINYKLKKVLDDFEYLPYSINLDDIFLQYMNEFIFNYEYSYEYISRNLDYFIKFVNEIINKKGYRLEKDFLPISKEDCLKFGYLIK